MGRLIATLCVVLTALPFAQRPLPLFSAHLPLPLFPAPPAGAAPELVERLRAEPFAYFRFVNRAWTSRVCQMFADVREPTIVRLHGDAHVEQFALTEDDWGLDDF